MKNMFYLTSFRAGTLTILIEIAKLNTSLEQIKFEPAQKEWIAKIIVASKEDRIPSLFIDFWKINNKKKQTS